MPQERTGSDLRGFGDDEATDTPQNVPESDSGMPEGAFRGAFEGDGWRLESKGRGTFGFRRGGGYQRQTMLGTYLKGEQLSNEQLEQHKQNATKQSGARQRAKRARGE
jgi:hypothetical protein